jgi:hypothetical protein
VDVLWNKKNLSEPYSYNQLADYIEKSSKFDTNLKGKISIGKVLGKASLQLLINIIFTMHTIKKFQIFLLKLVLKMAMLFLIIQAYC